MSDSIITYEHSIDTPFYCKLSLANSSVVVGEVSGKGDGREWEIIDCFNGKQLFFIRITDDHTTPADLWPDLMMKAHCELITLQQKVVEQAKRDKEFCEIHSDIGQELNRLQQMIDTAGWNGHTATTLGHARNCLQFLEQAYEALDEVVDPSEEA